MIFVLNFPNDLLNEKNLVIVFLLYLFFVFAD